MFKRRSYLLVLLVVFVAAGAGRAGVQKWEAAVKAAGPLHWYRFSEAVGATVAADEGSGALNGTYRSLVDLGQEGLFGEGQAVRFERGGQDDAMYTGGGNVASGEWTAEFIVLKASDTEAQALADSGTYSLRLIGYGTGGRIGYTHYGVVDAEFTAVGGGSLVLPVQQWLHIVYRRSGSQVQLFVNGLLYGNGTTLIDCPIDSFGGRAASSADGMDGFMDEAVIYDRALTDAEILAHAEAPFAADINAALLQPENGAVETLRDTVLAWLPGMYAETHDVYLGTTLDEVAAADRSDASGILVSQGQTDTTYDPAGGLEYGQTYYWRVDEVNAAPDHTIFKGDVWSFTVEAFAYPITTVTATASAFQPDMGPENTINGSGLVDDQHGADPQTMWMTPGGMPAWIQYEFDKVYKLHELWVWNSNQMIEGFLGFGAKSVTIEYSADGEVWTTLEGTPEFNRADGMPTYTANTTVPFGGAAAKFVRITIHSNWGGMVEQTGLSEVRFFYVPVQAFEPSPTVGATGVSVEAELSWRPGREATSHTVTIGADSNAVAEGTVAGATVTDRSYTPASLSYATTYYWKVDENGDAGTYAGDVWSFTTEEFTTVEDFESYNDDVDAETTIWHTWIDGVTDGSSGSQVGYNESPFAEQTIVHGGSQAMPLIYANTSFAFSEAKRTFDSAQDWTARGVKTLSVHFAGAAGNTGTLYVKINSTKVVYDGDAADVARTGWQVWNIDLSAVAGNLAKVTSLAIGIEGSGAAGTLYVDDIRLSPKTREFTTPAEPDSSALIARWAFDGDAKDSSGKGRNGTVNGGAIFVPGIDGQAVNLDGSNDFVSVGSVGISGAAPRTICGWAKADTTTITDWTNVFGFTSAPDGVAAQSFDIDKMGGANTYCIHVYGWERNIMAIDLEWHHLAATYDGTTIAWYGDGVLVSSEAWVLDTQDNFQMGKRAHAAGGNFPGSIDEVRVYNKALSAEEIAWLAGRRLPVHKPL